MNKKTSKNTSKKSKTATAHSATNSSLLDVVLDVSYKVALKECKMKQSDIDRLEKKLLNFIFGMDTDNEEICILTTIDRFSAIMAWLAVKHQIKADFESYSTDQNPNVLDVSPDTTEEKYIVKFNLASIFSRYMDESCY